MANSKLRKLIRDWINEHPNIKGTGRYTLRYCTYRVLSSAQSNVPGIPGLYVTKNGRVYHKLIDGKWHEATYIVDIKATKNRSVTAENVGIRISYKHQKYSVSRLVAMAWVSNPDPSHKVIVMHLDNDHLNNNYLNLKWGTQSENILQAKDEGRLTTLFVSGPKNPSYGKPSNHRSLTDDVEKKLVEEFVNGATKLSLANTYGISRATVLNIIRRHCHE